jgi:DNA-binding transcriptional regulator YdaS (Cro superfamily)
MAGILRRTPNGGTTCRTSGVTEPTMSKRTQPKRRVGARQELERLNGGQLTFGQVINATRLGEELSLEAFAERLGVSRAYLCDVEKGRRAVSVERAAAWARALGYVEAQYVALALQAAVNAAGLKLRVRVDAA